MLKKMVLTLFGILGLANFAGAEERFGVAVFPGAKVNAEVTAIVRQLSSDGTCYQTNEQLGKVLEFYRKQAGLRQLTPPPGVESTAKVFMKGEDIQVRVQPYPPRPNEIHICIVKE